MEKSNCCSLRSVLIFLFAVHRISWRSCNELRNERCNELRNDFRSETCNELRDETRNEPENQAETTNEPLITNPQTHAKTTNVSCSQDVGRCAVTWICWLSVCSYPCAHLPIPQPNWVCTVCYCDVQLLCARGCCLFVYCMLCYLLGSYCACGAWSFGSLTLCVVSSTICTFHSITSALFLIIWFLMCRVKSLSEIENSQFSSAQFEPPLESVHFEYRTAEKRRLNKRNC